MEFKAVKNEDKLDTAAIEALAQIKISKYVTVLKSKGVEKICSIGISFSGKSVKVVSDHGQDFNEMNTPYIKSASKKPKQ